MKKLYLLVCFCCFLIPSLPAQEKTEVKAPAKIKIRISETPVKTNSYKADRFNYLGKYILASLKKKELPAGLPEYDATKTTGTAYKNIVIQWLADHPELVKQEALTRFRRKLASTNGG